MVVNSPKDLANFVSEHRKLLNMTQAEVGDHVGLKQATISSFENNPSASKLDTLFRILSATEVELVLMPKRKSTSFEDHDREAW